MTNEELRKFGQPGAIAPVPVKVTADEFENAVRKIGATFACEWFGHSHDSEFTRETIHVLMQRSELAKVI